MFSGREGGGLGAAVPLQRPSSLILASLISAVVSLCVAISPAAVRASDPFASGVLNYDPAPGQFVNESQFNDASKALGAPNGGGSGLGNNLGVVTLGGFGGTITLAFAHTVFDDHANPFGLDAIVFGNAFWVLADPNRRWGEAGVIE
ncbi:MAG: hypothetical protein GXP29_10405, partial [Planctomycetes bacterium]|nr:hypothetical protein [Planctomycetota bacterium]